MPKKPPKPTTANMILLDVLSRMMSSTLPIERPGVSRSTMKALTPRAPLCGAVLAKTV